VSAGAAPMEEAPAAPAGGPAPDALADGALAAAPTDASAAAPADGARAAAGAGAGAGLERRSARIGRVVAGLSDEEVEVRL
jgi:hypothetical protein